MTKIIKEAKHYVNKLLLPLWNHYYHSYDHALEVMQRAIYLWEKEWLSKEDIEILALSALFHDTGFLFQYEDNEQIWAKIAKNYLKTILYSEEKIKLIEEIILATRINYTNPKNIYEKIIKDADLDNLWRKDFVKRWNDLKKELEIVKNIKIKDPDWEHASAVLLKEHRFFTESQRKEREKGQEKNLKKIENKILKENNTEIKRYI